jgi:dihydroxyacid dehydratase/phosphogluconate dehydratase
MTVTGKTLGENIAGAKSICPTSSDARDRFIGRGRDRGAHRQSRAARLRDEARRRRAALPESIAARRSCSTITHDGARIERDDLDVTPDHVLVLKNAGPKGGPGMPEWGMLPIPKKLVKAGRARHGAHCPTRA